MHLFTVDVEEYFHAAALASAAPVERWISMESRVERGVDSLLEMMDAHGARGTFFTLGWVAERQPWLVRRIADAGHEVASHGWAHQRVTEMGPRELRADLRRSRRALEDACGQAVLGFRAPNFSILRGWQWALDVLLDEGYAYDSSLFPSRTRGLEDHPPRPHVVHRTGGDLLEVPLACATVAGVDVPSGGGAWFRLLPYALTRRALRQAEERGAPGMFYIHPWELDADQPRLAVSVAQRLRHYGGLGRTAARLNRLLTEFRFTSIRDGLGVVDASSFAGAAR